MGVSGAGKSTLGKALAERLGYQFIEADALHSPDNVAKMSAGVPLDDLDREPWLRDVGLALGRAAAASGGVAACSALKRRYRDQLRGAVPGPLAFIHPVAARILIERRLSARAGHFMPPGLLASQVEALEPPATGELAVIVDAAMPTSDQVIAAIAALDRDSRA